MRNKIYNQDLLFMDNQKEEIFNFIQHLMTLNEKFAEFDKIKTIIVRIIYLLSYMCY